MPAAGNERFGGRLRRLRERAAPRTVALLGGTTTLGDCLIAIAYLVFPIRLVRGRKLAQYERAFARHIGVSHACSFSSGRVGLYGLLRALGLGPGDEVLLQVPTHIVVANAIRYTGARPVYVDCTADTYEIDLRDAERKTGPRTRVLILQHTFGIPCDLDGALALARRHGLEVIEDCVHALGARYDGRQVGSFGRAAFFSTEETKTISTTMGGMVTTADAALAASLRDFQRGCELPGRGLTSRYLLKLVLYHVLTQPHIHYYARRAYESLGNPQPLPEPTTPSEKRGHRPPGYERRLANAQAALGIRQLARLSRNLSHREAAVATYAECLARAGIELPRLPPKRRPAYVRLPLVVADRAAAVRGAARLCVLGTWFTSVLEESSSPADGDYEAGACPTAEAAARHLVNLPTHLRTRRGDAEAIVSALLPFGPSASVEDLQNPRLR